MWGTQLNGIFLFQIKIENFIHERKILKWYSLQSVSSLNPCLSSSSLHLTLQRSRTPKAPGVWRSRSTASRALTPTALATTPAKGKPQHQNSPVHISYSYNACSCRHLCWCGLRRIPFAEDVLNGEESRKASLFDAVSHPSRRCDRHEPFTSMGLSLFIVH